MLTGMGRIKAAITLIVGLVIIPAVHIRGKGAASLSEFGQKEDADRTKLRSSRFLEGPLRENDACNGRSSR